MNNDYRDYLMHHGIKGQKWGVRRYQNEDGSYTQLGEKRYLTGKGGASLATTRPKNVTGSGKGVYKRGSGIGNKVSEQDRIKNGRFNSAAYSKIVGKRGGLEAEDAWL